MSARRIASTVAALVTVSVLALASCTRGPDVSRVHWRLVDSDSSDAAPGDAAPVSQGPARARGPARATIADEMRYTFARPATQFLRRDRQFTIPSDGTIRRSIDLPKSLGNCRQLVVQLAMTGPSTRDARSVVGLCTAVAGGTRVEVEATVSPALHGQAVDLWIHGRPMPPSGVRQRRFTLGPVPAGARLALSYGVESPGWEAGSPGVVFTVRADGEPDQLWSATLEPAARTEDRRWVAATIALDRFEGRDLGLTLETAPAPGGDPATVVFPVWGNPTIVVDAPADERRPWNVLLVSLDTLRARSLGSYGQERRTSPRFDALAREGTLFEVAVVQSTLTPVSNMSLFTALYPQRHGVTDLKKPLDTEHISTLPEQLRRAGYATGAVTEDGLLQPALGFERGFDDYHENKSPEIGSTTGQIERTFQDAVRWMHDHRTLPFFLFVHTYQVHAPYTPPPPYRGGLGPTDSTGPAADRDRYEEEIQYTDAWLARLWDGVRELGLDDRTILVVTSDHGEEFGEHGALDHGAQLYDETLLVPLVIRAPGLVPAGERIGEPVALVDLAPTLLDLLGLPALSEAQGESLVALFGSDAAAREASRAAFRSRFIYGEAWAATRKRVDGSLDPAWVAPVYSLRSPSLKLIWAPAKPPERPTALSEAYDLATDPGEQRKLAPDDAAIAAARAALDRYVANGAAASPEAEAAGTVLDPTTHEKLRALGYLR